MENRADWHDDEKDGVEIFDPDVFTSSTGNLMDSKTSHLDDELNRKLSNAFHQQTSQILFHDVAKIASEYDPIDLAYAVTRLPPSARIVVYDNLPDLNAKIIFMINTGSSTRSACTTRSARTSPRAPSLRSRRGTLSRPRAQGPSRTPRRCVLSGQHTTRTARQLLQDRKSVV